VRQSTPAETLPAGSRWLTPIIAAGALLIPLVMSLSGEDAFRFPKELALRAEVILISVVIALIWGLGRPGLPRLDVRANWFALTALICGWTIVCTFTSTNRLVSVPATVRVLEYAFLFVITVLVLRTRPAWFAGIIVFPAIVNGTIYILQELEIWSPFDTSGAPEKHLGRTALIGNPNDVGGYFVVPALVALALALSSRRFRLAWVGAAAFILAATYMTHTVAAIGALSVAVFVMIALWLRSWPKTLAVFLVLVIAAALPFTVYRPLRDRALLMRDALKRRDYEAFSAARTLPFLTAAEMIRDHPLMGVGPGGFGFSFFDYKLRLQERHRQLFEHTTEMNYGEVHNDHLQVASETGLPGYALFVTALALVASATWRRRGTLTEAAADDESRATFVRLLALPLAVSLFILALAQFPLELVAPTHAYLWAAAAIVAWRVP
jgi:O-antigen ligase